MVEVQKHPPSQKIMGPSEQTMDNFVFNRCKKPIMKRVLRGRMGPIGELGWVRAEKGCCCKSKRGSPISFDFS